MRSSEVIFVPLVLIFLWNSFQRDKGQHRLIKSFHALFMTFIVAWHCNVVHHLIWSIAHPKRAYHMVIENSGIFPTWLYFPVWLLTLAVLCYGLVLAFSMAKRNAQSVRKFMTLLPFLWILDALEIFRMDTISSFGAGSTVWHVILFLIDVLFMGLPYMIMLLFYRSRVVSDALFHFPEANVAASKDFQEVP